MHKLVICFSLILFVGPGVRSQPPGGEIENREEAERVWEMAVKSQGGREKLTSISNEVVISRSKIVYKPGKTYDHVSESLLVFPDRWWNFDDNRPSVLGVIMRMENYQTKQNYIARIGQDSADLFPISSARLDQSLDEKGNVRWLPGFSFLLETKWWRPQLRSVRRSKIGKQEVDIIETSIFGRQIDYYFDCKSHLNIRQVLHAKDEDGKEVSYTSDTLDHKSVDGVMLPSKISSPDVPGVQDLSFELNVIYNESIFERAPLPAGSAYGAWRKKSP